MAVLGPAAPQTGRTSGALGRWRDAQARERRTFRERFERPADRGCVLLAADLARCATARLRLAATEAAATGVGATIRLVAASSASNLPGVCAAATCEDGAPGHRCLASSVVRGPTTTSARGP